MSTGHEVTLPDGRVLRVHDTGPVGDPAAAAAPARDVPALLWQTGSPQTGALLAPVVSAAAARGLRVVSYGRPGYGGSTRQRGRRVSDAAGDVSAILDHLGIDRVFAVGASGGGPHSLAAAALLGDRVAGTATFAGIAPRFGPAAADRATADADRDTADPWLAGMQSPGGLRAALDGTAAREAYAATDEFDPESFIAADYETLRVEWAPLAADAGAAGAASPGGLVDDDVAFASDWGFDPRGIASSVLVVQGGRDRVVPPSHGRWLFDACGTELWLTPADGHISILRRLPAAIDWLVARA